MKRALPLLLLLAACSASDKAPVPDSDSAAVAAQPVYTGPKACDLIKVEDIRTVTKGEFESGVVENDYAGDSQCRFDRPDTVGVLVTLHAKGNITPYLKVPNSSVVSGVGDEAVWNEPNMQLAVRHGEAVFSIAFLAPPGEKRWAISLAKMALTRF